MKHSISYIFWFWIPPLGYMIAIFFMSSISDPQMGGYPPDYVLHSIEYFVLTLLLIRFFLAEQPPLFQKLKTFLFSGSGNTNSNLLIWNMASLAGVLVSIFYGITDEMHQYLVPGRYCSMNDLLANSFGAFLAYGISMLDYLIMTKTTLSNRLRDRIKGLEIISYANYVNLKPGDFHKGLELSPE